MKKIQLLGLSILFLFTIASLSFSNPFNYRELSVKEKQTLRKGAKTSLHFLESKVRLDIDDAVTADTEISCVKTDFSYHAPDFKRHSPIYSFGPHGLNFTKDILLTLSYDDDPCINKEYLGIYYFDPATGTWIKMPTVSNDPVACRITCRTSHFSDYAIGASSYKISEGISPNSVYFASNNERTDPATGNMYIDRTDISIPGRGIDLKIESSFASDRFYYTKLDDNSSWDFTSELEKANIYGFGAGWRFKFPAIRCESEKSAEGITIGRIFYLYTPSGKRYRLPVTAVQEAGKVCTVEGFRLWKTNTIENGYHIILELIEEQISLTTDVLYPGTTKMQINPEIYFPDGSVCQFFSSTSGLSCAGNVRYIRDSSRKNTISITYTSGGKIAQIVDTLGKTAVFNYTSGKLAKITYDSIDLVTYRINSSNQLTGFGQLVDIIAGVPRYKTTTYVYTGLTGIKINYPSGGSSEYSFGDYYTSYTTISIPTGTIYQFHYRPAVKTFVIKADATDTGKSVTYNYCGAKTLVTSTEEYATGYYSLLKENNPQPSNDLDWQPWENCFITYTSLPYTFDSQPAAGNTGFRTMRSEVADSLKKTAICYVYDKGVFKGAEKEISYLKNGSSWKIDRETVNEFEDINNYSDYFRINKSSYHLDPTSDLYPGTSQYNESSDYDGFGRMISATDAEGNKTEYSFIYPSHMDQTGVEGVSYTNKLNKMGLCCHILRKQKTDIEYVVNEETLLYYEDNTANLRLSRKAKQAYNGGDIVWADTRYAYDPNTNNLLSITDPLNNVLSLEYETTHNAFISKDIRTITPAVELGNGITATGIVNAFAYDNLGRLETKRTAYTDTMGNEIPGYASETSHYKYDYLGRVTEVTTGAALKKYVYGDALNTLTAYSLVESLGGNSYLAVKSFRQYDGLDRKTAEETARLNITIGSGNTIAETTTPVLTSKKAYEYHPVFLNTLAKTTVYGDTTTAAQITETSFDNYARPLQIKVNSTMLKQYAYDDFLNQTIEKSFRDTTNYTLKGIRKDRVGNTRWVFDWPATTGTRSVDDAQAKEFRYDAFGNKIRVKIPPYTKAGTGDGEEFNYNYNSYGQAEKTEYYKGTPDAVTEESKYDNNGNLVEFKDRAGNKTICEYNSLNQMAEKRTYKLNNSTLTLEEVTEIQYSQFGTPIRILKKDGNNERKSEYHYAYNNLGQLTEFGQFVGNETDYKHYSVTNTYDLDGNLDTTKLWDGEPGVMLIKALDYDMASVGNESTVYELTETGKGDLIAKVKTKLWGGISRIEYGSTPVMTTDYAYNNLLQPTGLTNTGRMALSYDYDLQGNVTRWTNETAKTFTYDGLDRLLTETAEINTDKYFYDAIGNRTAIDKGNNGTTDITYTYDPVKKMQLDNYTENGQTWTLGYDANGNTTSKTDGTTSWNYIYNSINQLIEAKKDGTTIGQYEYDSNGLRIKKIESDRTTYYIYNGQSILFEETLNDTDTVEKREYNIELSGMNLAKYRWDSTNDWQLTYHLLDHLNSRQVRCDIDGIMINDNEYGTYGEYKGGIDEEYNFTGKQRDSSTGLVYFNARFYDPIIGRFTIIDPKKEGSNFYIFCRNNPLRYFDPDGLETKATWFESIMDFFKDHPLDVGCGTGVILAPDPVVLVAQGYSADEAFKINIRDNFAIGEGAALGGAIIAGGFWIGGITITFMQNVDGIIRTFIDKVANNIQNIDKQKINFSKFTDKGIELFNDLAYLVNNGYKEQASTLIKDITVSNPNLIGEVNQLTNLLLGAMTTAGVDGQIFQNIKDLAGFTLQNIN